MQTPRRIFPPLIAGARLHCLAPRHGSRAERGIWEADMADGTIILRRWSSRIRTADEADYVAYIEATGLKEYRATPGNLGCQMLLRALGDGSTEVTTLSWWESMAAITAFAGADPEMARYYPED